jgi:hypothetical protein
MSVPARLTAEMTACRPRWVRAAPGVGARPAGTTMMTAAPADTTAAAHHAPASMPGPRAANRPASQTPAAAPPAPASRQTGTASATAIRINCRRLAPRAASIAYSPARCAASSCATVTIAAPASRSSSTAAMASSDRETPRLVAVPVSTESRLVDSSRPATAGELDTVCRSADTLAAIVPTRPSEIADMSG